MKENPKNLLCGNKKTLLLFTLKLSSWYNKTMSLDIKTISEAELVRLRNVKGSREMIAENKYVIHDEESKKRKLERTFLEIQIPFI